MITPSVIWARSLNVAPYEQQIDSALTDAWTEEMKQKGRRVSIEITGTAARASGILTTPSADQLAILRRKYTKAGWSFREEPNNPCIWVFHFPKGKKP